MSAVVSAGDVVAGKYVVERILGEGGMGVVVAANHKDLGHRVAIKFLQPEALENPEIVARFEREARTLAKLRSEHVARVIDVGDLGGAQPYIVMEFLEGRDLSQLIDERGPLPIADAVGYILEAAHAIAEAHALGVVHRDLKPANLFLADQPDGRSTIKVLDFGIARHRQPDDTKLTRTGSTMGSPSYMAPEQMRAAETADERTDVWGFGAILFELLLGRVPFSATSVTEVVAKVLADPTPSLRAERADIPASLENVVFQCLAKKPAERFASVAELAKALGPHAPSCAELVRGIVALGRRGGQTAGGASAAANIAGADEATVLSRDPGPTRVKPLETSDAATAEPSRGATPAATPTKVQNEAQDEAPARDVARAHTSANPREDSSRWPWVAVGVVVLGGAAIGLGLRGSPAATGAGSASASAAAASADRAPTVPRHPTVVAPQPSSTASARVSATAESSAAPSASVTPSAAPTTSGPTGPRTSSPPVKTSTPTAAPSSSGSLNMGLK